MCELVVSDSLAIELNLLHINAFRGLVRSVDDKVLSACEVEGCLCKKRCADDVFCGTGIERIEAES